ncbi:hypothetical protein [Leisingera aquimarina]|uniref:hypothetical protein n=1 Tax=Leisingera aquimarina TaxID=476529 RepID=UPI00040B720E|nr:hypothetical protein [Leisingera aquimarina]
MAQTIILKRAEYQVFYSAMTANRRRLDALIAAAATLEDLAAVDLAEGWRLEAGGWRLEAGSVAAPGQT